MKVKYTDFARVHNSPDGGYAGPQPLTTDDESVESGPFHKATRVISVQIQPSPNVSTNL